VIGHGADDLHLHAQAVQTFDQRLVPAVLGNRPVELAVGRPIGRNVASLQGRLSLLEDGDQAPNIRIAEPGNGQTHRKRF